jgi:hypothetical protein
VIFKLGKLNTGTDHFSRILKGEDAGNADDSILDVHLFTIYMVNY